jgi:hypothetical protein
MAKDDDPQMIGEQPTKQKPGQDPDEANKTGLGDDDESQGFKRHGKVVTGVQPMTEDDIPEAGR